MNFAGRMQFRRLMCLLVRQNFSSECELGLNKQINLELKACHDYLAMAYHFDRCDVALPGVYKFFKTASHEERGHAELIMEYMNKRGGKILIEEVPQPKCSYESVREAFEGALEMERTVNESLLELHALGSEHKDPNLCDFLETNFLKEQVDAQKQLADYIRQIERCNKELGTYLFDINLKDSSMHRES